MPGQALSEVTHKNEVGRETVKTHTVSVFFASSAKRLAYANAALAAYIPHCIEIGFLKKCFPKQSSASHPLRRVLKPREGINQGPLSNKLAMDMCDMRPKAV